MDDSNKTIAIVINTSCNVYNFRLNLLKSLQKDGYHIVVIAPYDDYTKLLIQEGFEFHHLKLDNGSTKSKQEIKLLFHLISLYKKINPDIILHYTIKPNIYGNLAATLLKKSTINNISGLGTVFLNDKFSSNIAKILYKLTLKFSGKVFFQNQHDKKLFIDKGLIDKKLVELIPGSGIDTNYFTPEPFRPKQMTFLFIGRLIKDKGITEYIEAIKIIKKSHKNIKFQVIGTIYHKNPTSISKTILINWIKQDLIEYRGHTDDIKEHIVQASAIVLPSYREGLSRSLLEASSMAKPMVTTDVPGCNDIVDDGINGFLCKPKDAQSLADAMIKMIKLSEKERDIMGNKARTKVLNYFSQEIIINKYKEAITELIHNPKSYGLWGIKN